MKVRIRKYFLFALLIVSRSAATPAHLPNLRVRTSSGVVEGVAASDGPVAFLGIPYAAPPIGKLRWTPPRPAKPWQSIRSAKELGPSCPQQPGRYPHFWKVVVTALGGDPSAVPPLGPTSEDCLSLNVWTSNLDGKTKQPVLVWIHGARFIASRGGDEAALLARQGAVVVTINYRLGILGWLAHPALTKESPHGSSGNYGLLDQIEALRWIRRNIAAFGGDPNRVTVFGNSAGAGSILYLLSSPLARGLIKGAIVQSWSGGAAYVNLSAAESAGQQLVKDLVPGEDNPVASLRATSVDVLQAKTASHDFVPIEDGWVVPKLGLGNWSQVPLIIGAASNELTIVPLLTPDSIPKTVEAYRAIVQQAGTPFGDQLFAANPASSDEAAERATLRYLTDRDYICMSRYIAERREGHTWLYLLSVPTAATPGGERLGTFHGSDMRLLFNLDFEVPEGPAARRVGDAMRRYWIRFAATGDPTAKGLPEWPRYEGSQKKYLLLADPIRAESGVGMENCDILEKAWDNTSKEKTTQPTSFIEILASRSKPK